MSHSDPNDLNALIHQAASTAQKQELKPITRKKPALFKPMMLVLLAALTVYAGRSIQARLAPPGPEQITRDLETVLEKARDVVESAKKENGEYPEALPSAALASVVSYNRETNNYQLSATIMGIRVTLEPGGKKQIERGAQ